MRDGEFGEAVVPPEASGGRFSDDVLQLPRGFEGFCDDLLIGGHRVPGAADTAGASEVGDRKLLEDEAEGVAARQGREVRVHRGYGGVGGEGGGVYALGGGGVGAQRVEDIVVVFSVAAATHRRLKKQRANGGNSVKAPCFNGHGFS